MQDIKTYRELIEELKAIRIRITQIYMAIGNPNNICADYQLTQEIEILEEHFRRKNK